VGGRVGSGDRGGRDPGVGQQPVEQHTGPGAERAAGDPQAPQIGRAADAAGVALRYQQALLAAPGVDDHGLAAAEQGPGERAVAVTGAVPQVDGRGVGGAAPDPGQAVEAAARAHGDHGRPGAAQRDVQAGVIAAGQAQRRVPAERAPGRGVGSGRDPGAAAVRDLDHAGAGEVPPGPADGRGRGVIPLRGLADARQLIPARQHPRRDALRDVTADLEVPRHVRDATAGGCSAVSSLSHPPGSLLGSAPICTTSVAGGQL
jgi:hypothetical protein